MRAFRGVELRRRNGFKGINESVFSYVVIPAVVNGRRNDIP
jgi:hypothetical protein